MNAPINLHLTTALLLGLALPALTSCAQPTQPAHRVHLCDRESRGPCMTARVCDYDFARQCEVCRCSSPPYQPFDRPERIEVVDQPGQGSPPSVAATSSSAPANE